MEDCERKQSDGLRQRKRGLAICWMVLRISAGQGGNLRAEGGVDVYRVRVLMSDLTRSTAFPSLIHEQVHQRCNIVTRGVLVPYQHINMDLPMPGRQHAESRLIKPEQHQDYPDIDISKSTALDQGTRHTAAWHQLMTRGHWSLHRSSLQGSTSPERCSTPSEPQNREWRLLQKYDRRP